MFYQDAALERNNNMNQKIMQANETHLAQLGYMRYPTPRRTGGRSNIRQSLKQYAVELNRRNKGGSYVH